MNPSKKASLLITSFIMVLAVSVTSQASQNDEETNCNPMLNFETKKLHSKKTVNFCEKFNDKVLLVVNTASQCGFTPQFKELESLYQKYKDQGLEIVGFPSNDFRQEYKSEEQTASLCFKNFGVTFTMVSTSAVTGENKNSFYQTLADKTGKEPDWNFNKYLIDKDMKNFEHFSSRIEPLNSSLEEKIIEILSKG
jgi:glutathione peroxidase